MAFTKKQIVTFLSAVWLTALTILAGYALYEAQHFSLPIPNLLSALTVALPPLAGMSMQFLVALEEKLSQKNLPLEAIWQTFTVLFVVYETVLATLLGVHISPASTLVCGLRDHWQRMFSHKAAERIRTIQDAFSCCGFNGVQDMAYPFADSTHGNNACVVRYERDTRCLEPWRRQEQKVAAMLLVVPIAVFLWKLLLFTMPRTSASWLPSALRLPNDVAPPRRPRPQIGYRDDPGSREDDESLAGEVARLNSESSVASHVEGSRARPSQLWQPTDHWRDEHQHT